jgi:signal transduction histidine kinase
MSATTLSSNTAVQEQIKAQGISLSIWQFIVGGLGVVVTIALLIFLVTAFTFQSLPFLGMLVNSTLTVNAAQAMGGTDWAALDAGVNRGDQIIAINGEALFDSSNNYAEARERYYGIIGQIERGQSVDISYLSGNSEASITVIAGSLPDIDFLAYFMLPYFAGIVLLILGAIVMRFKYSSPEGLLSASIAFLSALFAGGIFELGTQANLSYLWIVGASWLGALFIIFGLSFPKRFKQIRQIKYSEHLILIAATIWGVYLAYSHWKATTIEEATLPVQLATWTSIVGVFILLLTNLWQRANATTPIARDQSNTIFIGAVLFLVPNAIWFLSRAIPTGDGNVFVNFETMMILFGFPNAAIVYSVLQYRLLDSDKIISQSITYLIMIGALIISVFLLAFGGVLISIEFFNVAKSQIMIAVVMFAMVLGFTPVRNSLQERIDTIYYKKRSDLQAKIEEFSNRLTALNSYDDIIKLFQEVMNDTLAPSSSFIFLREFTGGDFVAYKTNGETTDIRFASSSPLIKLMTANKALISLQPGEAWAHELWVDRPRLNLLQARLIIGMKGANEINGFVVLGPPRVNESYLHNEVRFLDNIVGQLAIATERSQVIESLERRVQELDVLSQVGQAVNFTIEFDDLLELMYAQISKLLPLPNFYIALYEEKINRMYFAFFLEGDDRHQDKEGVRWVPGNDIFSEITKKNTPMRLASFTEASQKRGGQMDLITEGLLGWMGVPLTAGRRTLGVMATGKRKDTAEYTEDQFKIFSDIGALAATSIDKANLFNQTRIRERQLTVLNDISRQLVAVESDVEKLLEIIMTRAVEILDADAGSLFLNTQDDSGDLEFRVVIGGGGDDLIGQRIPAGQGVVGKVVATGQHLIVNDAESDPRHNVNVTEDFVSRSLIAVPLIAKEEVIGVLEVINKRDGTPFVDEDADLLTTFSGQAAIAIENARLFQQTDLQLSLRVKELEALERLDNQLNRTLELSEVTEITVRHAMTILGANAGVLGLVHHTPPFLRIAAIKGYNREEYPESAEGEDGLIWPLDDGIVKRVLRSRQADIAMDVSIDPDYNSRLKNANSQITIPMISGDEVIAILILEKNTTPRFNLPEWDFAQRIAEHASVAIANAQFYEALNNANRSKSEFMGFAAHELKNPLASVKGYAEVMLSGMTGELSEQQENFVNIIRSNANRMQTIINDLRDSAKVDANEFRVEAEPMSIRNAVVESLRPFVKMLEDKNQTLVNDVPEDLPLIWGDETRVIQVLTNLVSNAHKYSYPDTTIRVHGYIDENYRTQMGERLGRMVVVGVKDQGIGLSEEDQAKMFKVRYFRSTNKEAHEMASGTGLGMMLTYNIMHQHKGEIWLESKLGDGTTFFISFPLAEDMVRKIEESAAD